MTTQRATLSPELNPSVIIADVHSTRRDRKGVLDVMELFSLVEVVHEFDPARHALKPTGVLYLSHKTIKQLTAVREVNRARYHDKVVLFDRASVRHLFKIMKRRGYL